MLAFVAIVIAGLSGAVVGFAVVDVDCAEGADCSTANAVGAIIGGLVGAGGVAIVSVLVLRAMSEWERNQTFLADRSEPEPDTEPDAATDTTSNDAALGDAPAG